VVLVACLSRGCASGLVKPRGPPAGSDAFQEGYLHGCNSGYSDADRVGYKNRYAVDQQRYASDADYRSGWEQGHNACYEDERRYPRMSSATRGAR
jgi:hypothetical protein